MNFIEEFNIKDSYKKNQKTIQEKKFEKEFLKNRGRLGIYNDLTKNLKLFLKKIYKNNIKNKDSIKNISKNQKPKLLDVGCGSGIYSNLAKEIGFDVLSVDYNPNDCKYNNIKVIKCDLNIEKLPFEENYFDVVIMTEVIEHLYNPGFIFSEINRVLKKGGFFYLTTPNIANIKNKICFLFFSYFLTHKKEPEIGGHIMHITPLFFKYFLERFNFEKIEINFINAFFPYTKVKLPNCELLSDNVRVISQKKFIINKIYN